MIVANFNIALFPKLINSKFSDILTKKRKWYSVCIWTKLKKQQQVIDLCKILKWSLYFNFLRVKISFTPLLFIYSNIKIQNISLHHHFQWLKTATVFRVSSINCICHLLISSGIKKKPLSWYEWKLNITCEQYFYPSLGLLINKSQTVSHFTPFCQILHDRNKENSLSEKN